MPIMSREECFSRRNERLNAFVGEVRRYLYNECLNHGITVSGVECFCHDMFNCMWRNSDQYSFFELLQMLTGDLFLRETFNRYRAATTN